MRNLHIRTIRLIELEAEPARGENGGEGEVEFAVCEADGFGEIGPLVGTPYLDCMYDC